MQGSPLLLELAQTFENNGLNNQVAHLSTTKPIGLTQLAQQAVDCYLKAGEVRAAVDCCVLLNHWQKAVALAEEHDFPQAHRHFPTLYHTQPHSPLLPSGVLGVCMCSLMCGSLSLSLSLLNKECDVARVVLQIEGLLAKYVRSMLDKGDKLLAVELYRNANKATEAAKLLAVIAEEVHLPVMGMRQGIGMCFCVADRVADRVHDHCVSGVCVCAGEPRSCCSAEGEEAPCAGCTRGEIL